MPRIKAGIIRECASEEIRGIIKIFNIVIRLTDIDEKGAREVADEIKDQMLPDYEDCIKSVKIIYTLE